MTLKVKKEFQTVHALIPYVRIGPSDTTLSEALDELMTLVKNKKRPGHTVVGWDKPDKSQNKIILLHCWYGANGADKSDFHRADGSGRLDKYLSKLYPFIAPDLRGIQTWTVHDEQPEKAQSELDLGPPRHVGIEDVRAFQDKFKVPMNYFPRLLDDDTFMYRFQFLGEELFEILSGHREDNLVKFADGLIDLAYVTYGTALMAGLGDVWPAIWARVQRANMDKIRVKSKGESKRGSSLDIMKPPGWQSPEPDIAKLIEDAIKRRKIK